MNYENGLRAFKLKAVGQEWYIDFLRLENRLLENIQGDNNFGSSEQSRRDRAQINTELNKLALKYLNTTFNDLVATPMPRAVDVLLLTAVNDEFQEIKSNIFPDADSRKWEEIRDSNGNPLLIGTFSMTGRASTLSILLSRAHEMGDIHSLARVLTIARDFTFSCVAMTGVCAGDADKVALGDLVFADEVWRLGPGKVHADYEEGQRTVKEKNDVQARDVEPVHWAADAADYRNQFVRDFDYDLRKHFPSNSPDHYAFNIAIGAVQTVPDVIVDQEAFKKAQEVKRSTVGIEMEGFGIALAAKELGVRWLLVKGVQDHAKPATGERDKTDRFRNFSAFASALFAIEFLKRFY